MNCYFFRLSQNYNPLILCSGPDSGMTGMLPEMMMIAFHFHKHYKFANEVCSNSRLLKNSTIVRVVLHLLVISACYDRCCSNREKTTLCQASRGGA